MHSSFSNPNKDTRDTGCDGFCMASVHGKSWWDTTLLRISQHFAFEGVKLYLPKHAPNNNLAIVACFFEKGHVFMQPFVSITMFIGDTHFSKPSQGDGHYTSQSLTSQHLTNGMTWSWRCAAVLLDSGPRGQGAL